MQRVGALFIDRAPSSLFVHAALANITKSTSALEFISIWTAHNVKRVKTLQPVWMLAEKFVLGC